MTTTPNERDREVAAAIQATRRLQHLGIIANYRAEIEAAADRRHNLLIDAMNLLEVNVRTKSRDDHAEQKMIVAIRDALWGVTNHAE